MKNPNYNEPGKQKPQGHRPAGDASHGVDNKFAPGEPGLDGTSDYDFDAIAPIRFKPGKYKSGGDINSPAPLT